MSKDSSAQYYQKTKKGINKKFVKDIKIFLKKKTKSQNMAPNDLHEHEKQRLVEYRKNTKKYGKIKLPHKHKDWLMFLVSNSMQGFFQDI